MTKREYVAEIDSKERGDRALTDKELIDELADNLGTVPGLRGLVVAALDNKDRDALQHAADYLRGNAAADLTKDFYTVPEAAAVLGVHPNTIYHLEQRREIDYYKPGKKILIPASEIERLKVERKKE